MEHKTDEDPSEQYQNDELDYRGIITGIVYLIILAIFLYFHSK